VDRKSTPRGPPELLQSARCLINASLARFLAITADETRQSPLPSRYGAICIARYGEPREPAKCQSAGLGTRNNMPYRRTPVLVSPRRSEPTHSAINVSPQPRYESERGTGGGGGGKRSCAFPGIKSALSYYNRIMASQPEASRPGGMTKNECCHAGLCLDVTTTSRGRRRCGKARRRRTPTFTTYLLLRYLSKHNGTSEDPSRKVR